MTKKEVEKQIKKEKLRIMRCLDQIDKLKHDIKATKKAIRFWTAELKKAK